MEKVSTQKSRFVYDPSDQTVGKSRRHLPLYDGNESVRRDKNKGNVGIIENILN
jgi:hypothetical protein